MVWRRLSLAGASHLDAVFKLGLQQLNFGFESGDICLVEEFVALFLCSLSCLDLATVYEEIPIEGVPEDDQKDSYDAAEHYLGGCHIGVLDSTKSGPHSMGAPQSVSKRCAGFSRRLAQDVHSGIVSEEHTEHRYDTSQLANSSWPTGTLSFTFMAQCTGSKSCTITSGAGLVTTPPSHRR